MVNNGPSKGCNTCKERRIKCDQGKPSCQNCIRLGRICGGYQKKAPKLRFRLVQSNDFQAKKSDKATPPDRQKSPAKVPSSLVPAEQDVAVSFFLTYFAIMGRELTSTRGFFEIIPSFLSTEHPSSALSVAVSAVATKMYRSWRRDFSGPKWRDKALGHALARLQAAIWDPIESQSQATVLAALVLQWDHNVTAVKKLRRVTSTHFDGAVALLKHQGPSTHSTLYGRHLLGFLLHTEVSSAIRDKQPIPMDMISWLTVDTTSLNPSSSLDMIGISVANLQYSFAQLMAQGLSRPTSAPPEMYTSLWTGATELKARLLKWSYNVPDHWRPAQSHSPKVCTQPIITYAGSCDVYPSVQIAAIWNVWRCYRLIVLKIILALPHLGLTRSPTDAHDVTVDVLETHEVNQMTQETVDSICQSVPFFMGNRTTKSAMSDLTSGDIHLPSYYDFEDNLPSFIKPSDLMSREEHAGHVIAQGPWHAMSPLSYVASLHTDPCGFLLIRALRPGQVDWIRAQLGRVALVMGLSPAGDDSPKSSPAPQKVDLGGDGEVDDLAVRIRKGLKMTSGL